MPISRLNRVLAIVPSLLAMLVWAPAARAADPASAAACMQDAMVVFDASGSMGTTDYTAKLPRIARVKQSMERVIPEIAPLRRLGLIVYGEGEYNACDAIELKLEPAANAADLILESVRGINPRGRTPLTESVRQAAEVLKFTERESVVVLLTDGEETCGGDPCKMAAELKRRGPGLIIHVIGYREGQESGYFSARCMADQTGGQYLSVATEEELVAALRKTLGCPFITQNSPVSRSSPRLAWTPAASAPVCRVSRIP